MREGSSQRSHASSGTITGIRSWMGAIIAFAPVVMIVNERITLPVSSSFQPAHSPASAIGRPSGRTMAYGCRTLPARCHS